MSILISELSMTPPLVFSVWISPSSSRDPVTELPTEEAAVPASASSSASPATTPSSGSSRTSVAPSSTECEALQHHSLFQRVPPFFRPSERSRSLSQYALTLNYKCRLSVLHCAPIFATLPSYCLVGKALATATDTFSML